MSARRLSKGNMTRSGRRTLKAHLEGQWLRGYGGPHGEVKAKKQKGAPAREVKSFLNKQQHEPVTLAEVWPELPPVDSPFRVAARAVIELNREALERLS